MEIRMQRIRRLMTRWLREHLQGLPHIRGAMEPTVLLDIPENTNTNTYTNTNTFNRTLSSKTTRATWMDKIVCLKFWFKKKLSLDFSQSILATISVCQELKLSRIFGHQKIVFNSDALSVMKIPDISYQICSVILNTLDVTVWQMTSTKNATNIQTNKCKKENKTANRKKQPK